MVRADTSADVTVTAVGYVCDAPGGFTLTYISDYEVGISWVKGVDAENTMVRAAIGRLPTDRDDGWLVYYGDGTSTTGWTNMETLSEPVYYRAWSENAGGIWEETGASDYVEGIGMQLIAFIALAVGLTIGGYALKRMPLCFGAGGAWLVMAFYSMSKSAGSSVMDIVDIYMALFWIGIGLVLVCMLEPAMQGRRAKLAEEEEGTPAIETEEDEGIREFTKVRTDIEQIKSQLRAGRPRYNRRRLSKFNKTGEIE